jgi:hypothetical protein
MGIFVRNSYLLHNVWTKLSSSFVSSLSGTTVAGPTFKRGGIYPDCNTVEMKRSVLFFLQHAAGHPNSVWRKSTVVRVLTLSYVRRK